jgi:hypothetical protein
MREEVKEVPNTMSDWQTVAHATAPESQAEWKRIFGRPEVPIVSILPRLYDLPGFDEPQVAYDLDLAALTLEQRQKLVSFIAEQFDLETDEVEASLDTHGCPVHACGVFISTSDPSLAWPLID